MTFSWRCEPDRLKLQRTAAAADRLRRHKFRQGRLSALAKHRRVTRYPSEENLMGHLDEAFSDEEVNAWPSSPFHNPLCPLSHSSIAASAIAASAGVTVGRWPGVQGDAAESKALTIAGQRAQQDEDDPDSEEEEEREAARVQRRVGSTWPWAVLPVLPYRTHWCSGLRT